MGSADPTNSDSASHAGSSWPSVTVVFLVFNRREQLRTSLREMLAGSDYPRDLIDVIVVDNASSDGSGEMVRDEFPEVSLITRERNSGVSGWNDGFAAARGDYVVALDDDCYLPGTSLRRAVAAARERDADLVSFAVVSGVDAGYRFDEHYRTGLLSFWGCAVLVRRGVLEQLGGYDPEIFVWANELEFMLRFFDHGFRHLHLPEVEAVHMKLPKPWLENVGEAPYRLNARHFSYIAAKLLGPRDATEVLLALVVGALRDALQVRPSALGAVGDCLAGFANGLRHREPLRNRAISRFYRRNFASFASPWWLARPPLELARALPGEVWDALRGERAAKRPRPAGRRELYYEQRAQLYPTEASTLEF